MTQEHLTDKELYAKIVCLFLAEELRTKKITLRRAAEIAKKVSENINLLNNEQDFLRFIKELSKDFEELIKLQERVISRTKNSLRKRMENRVKDYVIEALSTDPALALTIMQEAIKEETTEQDLKNKFPQFKRYLEQKHG